MEVIDWEVSLFAQTLAALLWIQPQPVSPATSPLQPAVQAPRPVQTDAQVLEPKWVWKLNDAHRYRVERTDRLGTEIITYKLVVRGLEKGAKYHDQLGLPDVEYAVIMVTPEELYFKGRNSAKPDCDTQHPDDADKNSIIGKLYAALKGIKARFITDDTGRVIAAESNWPVEIAYAQTGDPGSIIDEKALGATFDTYGLMARFGEITSTLAPKFKLKEGKAEVEFLESLLQDATGAYSASKDVERSIRVERDKKGLPTRITASGELKMVDDLDAPVHKMGGKLVKSSFERTVIFTPDGYVQSSTGKISRNWEGSEDTLEFKIERMPCDTPEPPYVPKSKQPK